MLVPCTGGLKKSPPVQYFSVNTSSTTRIALKRAVKKAKRYIDVILA
jgi:hypothetical protein